MAPYPHFISILPNDVETLECPERSYLRGLCAFSSVVEMVDEKPGFLNCPAHHFLPKQRGVVQYEYERAFTVTIIRAEN